jgi:hypothetical protein
VYEARIDVFTVRRYVGPLLRNSATTSRNVCSPPDTAGNTTSRTRDSGAVSDASAIRNSRFSLPVTFLNSAISSLVTLRWARASMRCTVAISNSTSASVISRSRNLSSAASMVSRNAGVCRTRCDGASTIARARHPATTFGATSANAAEGTPTARTARSLSISVSIEPRLTDPGTDLIVASSDGPSSAPAASSSNRSATCAGRRDCTRAHSVSSAWCNAERTMRSTRASAGGSMRSRRHSPSSSTRTRSKRRSLHATSAARHPVSFSASAVEHSRNPR